MFPSMLSFLCASLLAGPALAQEDGDVKTDSQSDSEMPSETEQSDAEVESASATEAEASETESAAAESAENSAAAESTESSELLATAAGAETVAEVHNYEPPSPLPSLNNLLPLPSWMSLEAGYVAEPFIVPGDSGVMVNYAQGVEMASQFSTGFGYDDAAKWLEQDHWILTLDVQQYNDTGDLGGDMGVVNSPQEISNPAGLYLGEVSITRDPGNGWLYFKMGSISMDADFLSPEAPGYYTNASFNNQYNVSMEVFPISPMIANGAVFGAHLDKGLNLKTGVYQLSSIRTDGDKKGWDWSSSADDGVVGLFQASMPIGHDDELSICPPDDHTFSRHASDCGDDHVFNELPGGRWQVGGFVSQYDFLDGGSSQGNHGAYANVTLPVPLPIGAGHRVWFSGVYGFQPVINPMPAWAGAGWMSQGLLNSRPLDLMLLGLSWSQLSLDELEQREIVLEMDYILVLTDTISLQPTVQYFLDTPSELSLPLAVGLGIHAGL